MKTLILSTLIVLFSLVSFAEKATVSENKELETQAFELLGKNVDSLKLEGNVNPDEKLRPIIEDLANLMYEQMNGLSMMSSEENNYKGNIKDYIANCREGADQSAECKLIIQYKPLGEIGITFIVGLDNNRKPESILNNRVIIDRGD